MTFLATNDVPGSELNRPFQRTMNTPGSIPGFLFYPHVGQVWIEGPYDAKGATDTASPQEDFRVPPDAARNEEELRADIISSLVKHAYRRPATPADLTTLTEFYQAGPQRWRYFRRRHRSGAAARAGRSGVRVSPGAGAGRLAAGKTYRISDLALASRLVVLPVEQRAGR